MAKKKKGSRPLVPVKSFMKPEWRRRIHGEGGPRELPPRTAQEAAERKEQARKTALPAWLKPFEIWRPTPEEVAERESRRRSSLVEHLVPRSELEYIERMRRGVGPSSGFRPQGAPEPRGRYGAPPPGARPGYRPPPPAGRPYAAPSGVDPSEALDLPALWDGLRRVRSDPRFRGSYGVGQISREGRTQAQRAIDVAGFFKVPDDVIRRYRPETLWAEWAEPYLRSLEDALNRAKPADIPGRLKFDLAQNGAFGLVYVE